MTRPAISANALIHDLNWIERSEAMVSSLSSFSDEVWDFRNEFPVLPRSDARVKFALRLDSGSLTDGTHAGLLDSLKCLTYSLVFDPPPPRPDAMTVLRMVRPGHGLFHFFAFLANSKIPSLAAVTKDDFDDFLEYICNLPGQAGVVSNKTLTSRTRGIEWISLQGAKLKDQLSFSPWDDARSAGTWARNNAQIIAPRGELKTQPLSDALVEAMVQSALTILGTAPDLEEKCREYQECKEIRVPIRLHYAALRSAVGFLVMLFSGMRLTEAMLVPAELNKSISIVQIRDGDRLIRGLFVHSTRSKSSVHIKDAWVTIPVVHAAITALSKIDALLPIKYSFLIHAVRFGVDRDTTRRLGANVFMNRLNAMAVEHGVDLSEVGGNISSLDFRRTFARLVTRKGLHVIELKEQLKHADANLTLQYGSPGLREHLVTEKQNYTRDQYNELLSGSTRIVGGGATEIEEMRAVFQGLTRGEKEDFLASLPKEALIDQTEVGLCRYRPHVALCGGNKIACRPDACTNSVIHVEEFSRTLSFRTAENARMLKIFARQPVKRAHLKAQMTLLNNLRRQIEGG